MKMNPIPAVQTANHSKYAKRGSGKSNRAFPPSGDFSRGSRISRCQRLPLKTNTNLLTAGIFLAALLNGLAQPVITTQPQDQTNYVGTTATFTAIATGTNPVFYQWQKFSTSFADLANRTNAVLTLTNVQTNDAADYRVVVTDANGTNISGTAHLYVTLLEKLFISLPAPGLVTVTWSATNMVLLRSRSMDCPAWVRVYGSSSVTLPVGLDSMLFRLAIPPPAGPSQSDFDECLGLCCASCCENYVAAFLINPERSGLAQASQAASIGMELSGFDPQTACVLDAQSHWLSALDYQGYGP